LINVFYIVVFLVSRDTEVRCSLLGEAASALAADERSERSLARWGAGFIDPRSVSARHPEPMTTSSVDRS